MKLYKHQQQLVDLNPDKHGLFWQCGTGKTLAAIELAKDKGSALIVCPKSIKEQWEEQIDYWHVFTKEEFRKAWNKLPKYDCLIIDEAHYFSGIKSQMYKSLIKYVKKHNPQYIYLLTATPYLSTPFNIYCLASILGCNWSYQQFFNRFFTRVYMGSRLVPVIKTNIEPQIAKLVNTIGNTVKLQDCVDVPEQIYQTEYFGLTLEQCTAIERIKSEETNHIVKWTRIHQVCGGSLKGDGYTETRYFKSEKLDRLKDICKEHKKVVVVCRYNAEVEMITDSLKEKYDGTIINITGQNKDRHHCIQVANKEDKCLIIINAACCEGYELPTFDLMVFYSYDFSLKNYLQMKGRIQRINNVKKNVYLSLIVKDTIDEDVKKSLDNKVSFDIEIYNK